MDPVFKNIPKGQPCFVIWRIENFNLQPIPKDQYGHFYEGDSYLILSVFKHGQVAGVDVQQTYARKHFPGQITEAKGQLEQNVHFWLGKETSQDESGTAAIKAVELDDFLGGAPVEYREVQGNESKLFMSYFKKTGVHYMKGGAKSGFTHVDHKVRERLIEVKGKRSPRLREVDIGWEYMNDGDAYILDVGMALFVWLGKNCSLTEKRQAMEAARRIRDDRGKANCVTVEDGQENERFMSETEYKLFIKWLPVNEKSKLKPQAAAEKDEEYERQVASRLKLWKCAEEGNTLKVTEVGEKPLKRSMLDSNDCFIVDNGAAGIWFWCGKKASKKEKSEGMRNATAFIQQRGYPQNTQVRRVKENCEPPEFKWLFKVWEVEKAPGSYTAYNPNRIARSTIQTKFDASLMHQNPAIASATGMVDDGTGTKRIWRAEKKGNFYDKHELDKRFHEQLFGGDCYIILYSYAVGGRTEFIVYYWLGRKSTQDEQGAAAKLAAELDNNELAGAAKQVRVVHGSEPPHFLAMFQGRLVIYDSGRAGVGHYQEDGPGDTYLLHVRGTSNITVKAEQVPCRAESLNSNDVFVFVAGPSVYIWAGKGCTGDEREMAKQIAGLLKRGYTLLSEGQEKKEFWDALGGKTAYSTSPRLQENRPEHAPRLFQCSNASGRFVANEIVDFSQQDLVTDDVFILDTYDQVYIWIGNQARQDEKELATQTAIDYVKEDPSERDPGTPIFMVKQGLEPPDFIGFFGVWDRELWSGGKTYEQLKRELGEKNVELAEVKELGDQTNGDASFSDVAKYSLEVLQDKENLPEGIDLKHKEKHLAEDEFQKIFKMQYADFMKLADWKQLRLKKDAGLW